MAGVQSPPPQPYYGGAMSPPQMQAFSPYPPGSPMPAIRPGTLPPGTAVKIGDYAVVVQRFLSEGGFAHVYLVNSDRPIYGLSQHVLKRVAVPDKDTLKEVRWEVDVMKAVRGHKHIVNLIEASASPIPGTTGYEVFILMEYCAGGGIIDMMNTRLQNRLTESEILKIFSDVVEGVCHMHTRDPPLIHRDLKVENILLASSNLYKLCDFGSTTTPSPHPPSTMAEIQALEAELNKHTTLQYRAPEMCDVWSRKGVGLPADIWALGVLLYKLCFYTTPFEEQGPLAILNVQYKMPSFPAYSDMIRRLISGMLVENAKSRPTAWQVHEEVSRLRGMQPKAQYKPRQGSTDSQPTSRPHSSLEAVVADRSRSSSITKPPVSDLAPGVSNGISPMRRGRPNKGQPAGQPSTSTSGLSAEWQIPRAGGPSPQPPISAALSPNSQAAATVPGFGDSFAPTVPVVQPPSPSAVPQDMTSLAAAQIFEDLAAPDGGKSRRAQPTLASMAAAKSGNGPNPVPVQAQSQSYPPALAPRPPQGDAYGSNSTGSSQKQSSASAGLGLRRVTPTKPLGPRPAPQAGSSAPTPSSTSNKPIAKSKPASFSQAKAKFVANEQLPESVAGSRPDLISRASQTSPSLMSEWKRKSLDEKEQAEREGRSRQSVGAGKEGEPARFPSIDEWESTGFSPPSSTSAQSRQNAVPPRAVLDLLGDDEDGMGIAPAPTISTEGPSPTPPAPVDITHDTASQSSTGLSSLGSRQEATSPAARSNFLSASPPILSQSPSHLRPSPSPSAVALSACIESDDTPPPQKEEQSPKEKFKPVKRESPVVSRTSSLLPSRSGTRESAAEDDTADSSDDEQGPEQLENDIELDEGGKSPSSRPPLASRNGSYKAGPAAPSAKTAAMQVNGSRPPPILAPKPQRAGINSIVSRYETLSTAPKSSKAAEPASPVLSRNLSQNALPKPTKPRGVSISDSAEDFASRYPALDLASGIADPRPVPSVTAGSPVVAPLRKKEPFKPSRENSSTSLSGLADTPRARPQSIHFPTPPPSDPNEKPRLTKASVVPRTSPITPKQVNGSPEEDKDTPFAGVASLRDRWEKKVAPTGSTTQSSTLGRRASTAYK